MTFSLNILWEPCTILVYKVSHNYSDVHGKLYVSFYIIHVSHVPIQTVLFKIVLVIKRNNGFFTNRACIIGV